MGMALVCQLRLSWRAHVHVLPVHTCPHPRQIEPDKALMHLHEAVDIRERAVGGWHWWWRIAYKQHGMNGLRAAWEAEHAA